MFAIRRYTFILLVLIFGIILGNFSWKIGLLVATPLILILLMQWDETSYRKKQRQLYSKTNNSSYTYKK